MYLSKCLFSSFVRHSTLSLFFIYIRYIKCSSFVIRHSSFVFSLYISGISNVRPSFVVRRSTFNFLYACMIEWWNVRRSMLVKIFRYIGHIWRITERRTSNIPYIYHTCIHKIERRTSNTNQRRTFNFPVLKKVERRMTKNVFNRPID